MDEEAVGGNGEMNDDALQELLSFIDGTAGHGVGIRSYADYGGIHEGCLELERRGKIYRHLEDANMVIWMPKKEEPAHFIGTGDALPFDLTPDAHKSAYDYRQQLEAKRKRRK